MKSRELLRLVTAQVCVHSAMTGARLAAPLLAALPRVDDARYKRLKSIPGAPPNLLVEPHGCPFAARCEYTFDRCRLENPVLEPVGYNHRIACWIDVDTGKPR